MNLFLKSVFLFPHYVYLIIFVFLSIFFNLFGLEESFLFFIELFDSLFFMLELIFEKLNLLSELMDLSRKALFSVKVDREFIIKFLSEILEGKVGNERLICEREIGDRTLAIVFKPMGNGISFVSMPIGSDDRLFHDSATNGTDPLFLEAGDEAVVLCVHMNKYKWKERYCI